METKFIDIRNNKPCFLIVWAVFIVCTLFVSIQTNAQDGPGNIRVCSFFDINNEKVDSFGYNFDCIDSSLKQKKYIFLGEKTHIDGLSLILKANLIKYLHEKHGFNVLITEYGIFETSIAWGQFKCAADSGVGILSYLKYFTGDVISLDDIYLGRYISSQLNKVPLKLAGLDIMSASQYQNSFSWSLHEFFAHLNLAYRSDKIIDSYINQISILSNDKISFNSSEELDSFIRTKDIREIEAAGYKLIEIIIKNTNDFNKSLCAFFISAIKSEILFIRYKWYNKSRTFLNLERFRFYNQRDSMMAENLMSLITNVFPNDKIIISTSTLHMTKSINLLYSDSIFNNYRPMISYLGKNIIDSSYNIAFISAGGSRGKPGTLNFPPFEKVVSAVENSVERSLSKYNFCFVDLKKDVSNKKIVDKLLMSPIIDEFQSAPWSSIYDGLFFIKEMKPAVMKFMFNRVGKKVSQSNCIGVNNY